MILILKSKSCPSLFRTRYFDCTDSARYKQLLFALISGQYLLDIILKDEGVLNKILLDIIPLGQNSPMKSPPPPRTKPLQDIMSPGQNTHGKFLPQDKIP